MASTRLSTSRPGARILKINFLDDVIVGQAIGGQLGHFSFQEAGLLRSHKKEDPLILPMTEPFTLSSEPPPAKRQRLIPEPVELLIEHPLADRKWALAKELPGPQGQTLGLPGIGHVVTVELLSHFLQRYS